MCVTFSLGEDHTARRLVSLGYKWEGENGRDATSDGERRELCGGR